MSQAPRAADLPEGSVVADDNTVLIARADRYQIYPRWEGNLGATAGDADVDLLLQRGAKVLRVGTGEAR